MSKTNTAIPKPSTIDLKQRVLALSGVLPDNYIDMACMVDPELNTPKMRLRVKNVKNVAMSDLHITEILEKVAEKYLELQKSLKA